MNNVLESQLAKATISFINTQFNAQLSSEQIVFNETNKDFEGDITMVIFPLVKLLRKSPVECGEIVGNFLVSQFDIIEKYNVIQGFLNIVLSNKYWLNELQNSILKNGDFQLENEQPKNIVLEYCGPNTNKPLHLGHLRNMMIGHSVASILTAAGHNVHKVNIYNDRGIAICKSMQAWLVSSKGETPESSGMKGDHLAGKYYVEYDRLLKAEIETAKSELFSQSYHLLNKIPTNELKPIIDRQTELANQWNQLIIDFPNALQGMNEIRKLNQNTLSQESILLLSEYYDKLTASAEKENSDLLKRIEIITKKADELKELLKIQVPFARTTREMLLKWEAGDPETRTLWNKMNDWVYQGFQITFDRLGVDFEKHYKESEYYENGKELVLEGLNNNKFKKNPDGSVSADLTPYGLDEKILIRKDGTSIYLTQDLGIAEARYKDYKMDRSIYVVADEQNYHFKALKHTLEMLEKPYAQGIYHLAYGMVDLPTGRMKSREGTTVDADDLMDEMVEKAIEEGQNSGKIAEMNEAELKQLYENLGISAIKYFLLRIHPKKRMIFDPKESIDMQGFTAAFIQYAYTRISSLGRKYGQQTSNTVAISTMNDYEKELVKAMVKYPEIISISAIEMDPSHLAVYLHQLAKTFNRFYTECSVLGNSDSSVNEFRVQLCNLTGKIIKNGLRLLGINTPERM